MSIRSLSRGGAVALVACSLALSLSGCCGWDACADPCADPCPAPCPTPCPQPVAAACVANLPDAPPQARPGEAWCRVFIPPQYECVEERVCVAPASCRQEWVPPVYEERTRQICVKPASCRQIPIPAEYEEVEEQVCVCPAQTRQIPIPAEYQNVCEQVLVCPPRTQWCRVDCTPEQLAAGERQGDCWVLKEIPAVYKTVEKRVCVREASCRTETIPARYETRKRRVCVKPASFRTEEVPAEYRTVTERVCVKPGYHKEIPVPAQFGTRQVNRCIAPGRWEWRRNELCEVPGLTGPARGAPMGPPPTRPGPYDEAMPPSEDEDMDIDAAFDGREG